MNFPSTYQGVPIYCMVNPVLGHEYEYELTSVAYPPFKGEFATYTAWLYRDIQKYENISLHLNTELTAEMLKLENPDKVIIASEQSLLF